MITVIQVGVRLADGLYLKSQLWVGYMGLSFLGVSKALKARMHMVRHLHRILSWIVGNPFIQLLGGSTLLIYTLVDQEQTILHHGFRFFIIWRSIPDIIQALERVTKGLK